MSEMHEVTLAPMSKDALSKLRNGNRPCQCRLAGKGQKGPTCVMKMDNLEKLVKGDKKGSASRLVLDRDEIDANKIKGTGIMAGGRATKETRGYKAKAKGGKATKETRGFKPPKEPTDPWDSDDEEHYADAVDQNGDDDSIMAILRKVGMSIWEDFKGDVNAARKFIREAGEAFFGKGVKANGGRATRETRGYRRKKNAPLDLENADLKELFGGSVKIGKSRFGKPSVDRAKHNLKGGAVAQMPDGSYHVINNHPAPTEAQKRIAKRKMKHLHYSDDETRSTVPAHTIVRKHKGEGLVAGGRASKAKTPTCRKAAQDLAECQPWTMAARAKAKPKSPIDSRKRAAKAKRDAAKAKKDNEKDSSSSSTGVRRSARLAGKGYRGGGPEGGGIYGGPKRASGSGIYGGAIGAAERVGNVGAGGNLIGGTRMGHGALASQAQYSNPFFSTQFPPGMQTM